MTNTTIETIGAGRQGGPVCDTGDMTVKNDTSAGIGRTTLQRAIAFFTTLGH